MPSRERGRALIMAGLVYVNGQKAEKAGATLPDAPLVEIRGNDNPYVSRGGLKLEKGLKVFSVSPKGRACIDVGASTGGFTDCLLQHGARRVYAVDVGYGQLAWSLRNDERVVVMERTNIRNIDPTDIPDKIDLFTSDVSFISLYHVFSSLSNIIADGCEGICLVKPQFEAGKEKVGKNGVVKDIDTHIDVLNKVAGYALEFEYSVLDMDYSPIRGPKGNIEYLMHLCNDGLHDAPSAGTIQALCQRAQIELNGDS